MLPSCAEHTPIERAQTTAARGREIQPGQICRSACVIRIGHTLLHSDGEAGVGAWHPVAVVIGTPLTLIAMIAIVTPH
jgi:hypothetical protein